jgi:integrase
MRQRHKAHDKITRTVDLRHMAFGPDEDYPLDPVTRYYDSLFRLQLAASEAGLDPREFQAGFGEPSARLSAGQTESSSERNRSMARKRYQQGFICLSGKAKDKWIGRYREDVVGMDGKTRRVRREVILGTKRELPTKRLAQRRMDSVLTRINGLNYRPSRVATFAEFVERWKTEVLINQKPSSQRAVRSHLRRFIEPQLGKLRLEQFNVENQQAFVTHLVSAGVSRKTILNVLSTLSSILSTARDWLYNCEQIEIGKLRLPPRGNRNEARHFTTEQLRRILAVADEPWHTLFSLLTMTGLRAGEALGLQVGDIDFDRNTITVRRAAWNGRVQSTKTSGSATVLPIPLALGAILKAHVATLDGKSETFLFTTRNGRPPSSNKVVEYRLWAILDALNIPRCGLHAFRHSHAALLLDSGATPKVVQRQLRHADARTTLGIYGHVVGEAQREAVEKVAAIVDGSGRQSAPAN